MEVAESVHRETDRTHCLHLLTLYESNI